MRAAIWAWHVPYISMLAKALPEVDFYILPTPYNPQRWDEAQRPMPANVFVTGAIDAGDSVVIAQTPQDLDSLAAAPRAPVVYLAHNHWTLDQTPPERLAAMGARLVCISEMKARSWRDYGSYDDEIEVIPPGIALDEYRGGERTGRWSGKSTYVLTVVNGLCRPLFDLQGWRRATERTYARLVGSHNEEIRGAIGPAPSWEVLKQWYRCCRFYLNPTCPPYEDSYNLAALEAAACGAPVRNLHGEPPEVEDFPIGAFAARWRRVLEEVSDGKR